MSLSVYKMTRAAIVSTLLKWEAHADYSRAAGVLLGGDGGVRTVELGTPLGEITAGGAISLAQAADAGNTGNGTLTLADPAFAAGVKLGIYTAVCTTGGADATSKFRVEDPEGVTIGTATGGAAFNKAVKFTIAGGGTAFVPGDRFNVTVSQAAGSDDGKLVPWDPEASDGSEVLCGFSLRALDAPDGEDKLGLVYIRRTALLAGGAVRWPEGLSAAATATAIRDVEARLGIVIRT
ncbi:head decoration protein [Shinella sp.]|jgi:hypothetical protein|uniref:head decoration protein n=1 Tax=Shinella sp. TaxID=1870904 RepID=UPI003F6E66B2